MEFDLDNSGDIGMIRHALFVIVVMCIGSNFPPPKKLPLCVVGWVVSVRC